MSRRFKQRVEQDLRHIAEQGPPSSTAWSSIRTRIDAPTPKPDVEVIMFTSEISSPDSPTPRRAFLLGCAAVLVAAIVAAVIFTADDSEVDVLSPSGDDATAVIEAFYSSYNAGDLDAVMAVFSSDAVMVGHPLQSRIDGLADLRSLHEADLSLAADETPYSISNLRLLEDGMVTWDHHWANYSNKYSCGSGHVAEVIDGKIVHWTWPVVDSCAAPDTEG